MNLVDWEIDRSAVFSEVGEGVFRLATAVNANSTLHYRVGFFPPPSAFEEDFENGSEGWVAETQVGETIWELGTQLAVIARDDRLLLFLDRKEKI